MSFWGKVKGTLAVVAPTLGAAIGGPLGGAAGTYIAKALGKEGATDEDLAAAIAGATPEQILALKQAEIEFEKFLKNADIEIEKVHAGDRASARAMNVAVKDKTPAILALSVTIGFFGTLTWLLISGLPSEGEQALLLMLGSLGTAWTGIVAFYFGSSSSSRAKDDTIAALKKSA